MMSLGDDQIFHLSMFILITVRERHLRITDDKSVIMQLQWLLKFVWGIVLTKSWKR